ncbi:hypothetical protein COLO4_35529 [Corchorus olitorius]|uniref:Uncharacterized protein n=1 Tax=Corchorus olitorius TaxID=93759 RepID=A0A1R3GFQ6_9ROSI|nr:hypothetical protein COLO4_35529 [Corchorus olitorius]
MRRWPELTKTQPRNEDAHRRLMLRRRLEGEGLDTVRVQEEEKRAIGGLMVIGKLDTVVGQERRAARGRRSEVGDGARVSGIYTKPNNPTRLSLKPTRSAKLHSNWVRAS